MPNSQRVDWWWLILCVNLAGPWSEYPGLWGALGQDWHWSGFTEQSRLPSLIWAACTYQVTPEQNKHAGTLVGQGAPPAGCLLAETLIFPALGPEALESQFAKCSAWDFPSPIFHEPVPCNEHIYNLFLTLFLLRVLTNAGFLKSTHKPKESGITD